MNARCAVFALISIRSQPLRKLVNRLPYASPTIYNAVHQLVKENKVKNENGTIMLVEEYDAQKLSEIYIQCLSYGIDPEILTRKTTLVIWKSLEQPTTIKDIRRKTNLSAVSVKKVLTYLKEKDLVAYLKGKPIIAEHNREHILYKLLKDYLKKEKEARTLQYPGSIPFREIMETPDQVEKKLYQQIDETLTVKDTGFLVKGDSEKITILESVDRDLTYEETFLKKIFTTEGVEDFCLLMVKQGLLDYEELLALAEKQSAVNVVGCFLDILHSIDEQMIPPSTIERFLEHNQKYKKTFLSQEKGYGKQGWEAPFEERWNVELYLDLGAIKHGVGSL